jgi:hypothetical protein
MNSALLSWVSKKYSEGIEFFCNFWLDLGGAEFKGSRSDFAAFFAELAKEPLSGFFVRHGEKDRAADFDIAAAPEPVANLVTHIFRQRLAGDAGQGFEHSVRCDPEPGGFYDRTLGDSEKGANPVSAALGKPGQFRLSQCTRLHEHNFKIWLNDDVYNRIGNGGWCSLAPEQVASGLVQ